MNILRTFLVLLTMACACSAHAEVKVLSYTAVIDTITQVTDIYSPPPPEFTAGTEFTARWLIEDGTSGGRPKIHSMSATIAGTQMGVQEGGAFHDDDGLSLTAGPMTGEGPNMQWNYPDPTWQPAYVSFSATGLDLAGLPSHQLPTSEQLLSGDLAGFYAGFVLTKGWAWFSYEAHITSVSLEAIPPAVPEPYSWVLLLSGGALLGLVRRVRKSGSRSA